jgi:hypothetical protein
MRLMKCDHNKWLVTLTVITYSGFYCDIYWIYSNSFMCLQTEEGAFKYFFGVPHLATFIFSFSLI